MTLLDFCGALAAAIRDTAGTRLDYYVTVQERADTLERNCHLLARLEKLDLAPDMLLDMSLEEMAHSLETWRATRLTDYERRMERLRAVYQLAESVSAICRDWLEENLTA